MDNHNLRVRRGATLRNRWTNDEEGGVTATLTVTKDGVNAIDPIVAEFDGLVADLTIPADQTLLLEVDVYDYMITIVWDDGSVDKFPDVNKCKDCPLPTLTICEANDVEDES